MNYDSNVLEFVNLTPASMVTDLSEFNYYAGKIGIITLTYTPEDSFVTSDGLFVTVKMKVKDDAVPGNYQLIAENGERGSFHTIIYENGKVKENVWHYVYYKPAAVVVK
ncbi:MAG TPA: cohesin domain-containing protein [Bacillota bacterium]|nr:cohesin domain-containing protein [Bacillota bacterium]HOL09103.1 cohesin domain-containing protein [Bacillota bacterium]HPO97160.1 cohesin domain-containing protein [Bacillota bacterium]